ncbi:MAG: calcium-binding protein, partial [Cyanobacteria bacterium J06573_11]
YSSGTHGLPMNHEDSSGQGGTPMRQYQSLFEEYGVVAVFSGHSEMFERSFVDENNDGEGVYYYDVGVAGDGMRGQRTDEDGNLLGYNQFSQWTADQSEPELWQEVDGTLQNVAGGKHYGHLEVNLERTGENPGEADGTRITFTPVYSFPVLDANYDLVDTERRVYGDEIVIDVAGPTGVDRIFGTERADNIVGTDADEIIFGGALRDRIDGGAGDDQIFGEAGRDVIMGGDGDDLINGGLLNNNVFGEAGSDTFVLVVGGDTRIRDFTVGEDKIGLMDGVSFGQLSIEKRGQNALISVDDEIALRVMNTAVDALTESVFVAV